MELPLDLLSRFCRMADAHDAAGLAELFHPGGRLVINGTSHEGRERIRQALGERLRADRQTRHVWASPSLEHRPEGVLVCISTQLTFESRDARLPPDLRISDVRDVLRADASGSVRIEERCINRIFC